MVLTDREIQSAIENGQIKVEPRPDPDAYSSTSLDLTLSKSIRVWKKPADVKGVIQAVVCPGAPDYKYREFANAFSDLQEIPIPAGYILEPGSFVLGATAEYVELPHCSRVAARVEGKSSLARLGIGAHITAPTIHAGFRGTIELELFNHGSLRVQLLPGMRVCQLIFEQTLGTPEKGYRGQFLGQAQV